MEQVLVALHGLSRALALSAAWLKAEAEAGRIPSLRAGRKRLFSVEAVRALLLERAAGAHAAQPPAAASAGQVAP